VVESLTLEVLRKCLGVVLRDLAWWGATGGRWTVGVDDLEIFFNCGDSVILW